MKPYKYGYDKLASSTDAGKARIKMLREQFLRDDLKRIVGHLTKELKKSGGGLLSVATSLLLRTVACCLHCAIFKGGTWITFP